VGKTLQLRFNGRHNFRMTVTGVEYGNTTGKIDITFAFDVPHLGILGTLGINIMHIPDTWCDRSIAPVKQSLITGHKLTSGSVKLQLQ
jgi:hypothetical protein